MKTKMGVGEKFFYIHSDNGILAVDILTLEEAKIILSEALKKEPTARIFEGEVRA